MLHRICHNKIHSVFTEKELAQKFNTIEALLRTEQIQKFVKWVSKKPADYYDSNQSTNAVQAKRASRNRRRS